METQITFTFGQLLACIGTVCGTITAVAHEEGDGVIE